jgi:hypothetical protein
VRLCASVFTMPQSSRTHTSVFLKKSSQCVNAPLAGRHGPPVPPTRPGAPQSAWR